MSLKPFQTAMERIETIKKLRDYNQFSNEFEKKYENNNYLRELILWLIQKNPLQRPTINDILESDLLKQFQNSLKLSPNYINSNENSLIKKEDSQENSKNFFILTSILSQINMINISLPFIILKEIGTIISQMAMYYIHLNPLQLNLTFNKLKLYICNLEYNYQEIITTHLLNRLIQLDDSLNNSQKLDTKLSPISSSSSSLSTIDSPSINSINNGKYCMIYSKIDGYYDMILYSKESIEEYYRHATG